MSADCSSSFPPSPFSDGQLRDGAAILHFLALAVAGCLLFALFDAFAVPTTIVVASKLKLTPLRGGLVLLSAVTVIPPMLVMLFSSVMSDVSVVSGLSTILGSALINTVATPAVIATLVYSHMSPAPMQRVVSGDDEESSKVLDGFSLTVVWWRSVRDGVALSFALLLLVVFLLDDDISFAESVALIALSFVYFAVIYFDRVIKSFIIRIIREERASFEYEMTSFRKTFLNIIEHPLWDMVVIALVMLSIVAVVLEIVNADAYPWLNTANYVLSALFLLEALLKVYVYGFFIYMSRPADAFDGVLCVLLFFEIVFTSSGISGGVRVIRLVRLVRLTRLWRAYTLYRRGTIGALSVSRTASTRNVFDTSGSASGTVPKVAWALTADQSAEMNFDYEPLSPTNKAAVTTARAQLEDDEDALWQVVPPRFHYLRVPLCIFILTVMLSLCLLTLEETARNQIESAGATNDAPSDVSALNVSVSSSTAM